MIAKLTIERRAVAWGGGPFIVWVQVDEIRKRPIFTGTMVACEDFIDALHSATAPTRAILVRDRRVDNVG